MSNTAGHSGINQPRRSLKRTVGACVGATLTLLAAYLCVGTSCAPDAWKTEVERAISLDDQPVPMRLETQVTGVVQQIRITTSPRARVSNVVAVAPLSTIPDAAVALPTTSSADRTSSAGAAVSIENTAASNVPNTAFAARTSTANSAGANDPVLEVEEREDGSVIVKCSAYLCQAIEFNVAPDASQDVALRTVHVRASISGVTAACGDTAPSSLSAELTQQGVIEATP